MISVKSDFEIKMNEDSRNRIAGTSDRKRRNGRKKKRPRIFYQRQQNEAMLNECMVSTSDDTTSIASSNIQMLLTAKKPRPIIENSSSSRCIEEHTNYSRVIEENLVANPSSTSQNVISGSRKKIKCTYLEAGPVKNRILDVSLLFPS